MVQRRWESLKFLSGISRCFQVISLFCPSGKGAYSLISLSGPNQNHSWLQNFVLQEVFQICEEVWHNIFFDELDETFLFLIEISDKEKLREKFFSSTMRRPFYFLWKEVLLSMQLSVQTVFLLFEVLKEIWTKLLKTIFVDSGNRTCSIIKIYMKSTFHFYQKRIRHKIFCNIISEL